MQERLWLNITSFISNKANGSSPGVGEDVVAGEEKPPNDGVMLFPLVRPLRPLKPPPFPKPENPVGVELPLAAVVKVIPLKPLKVPPPSPWNKTQHLWSMYQHKEQKLGKKGLITRRYFWLYLSDVSAFGLLDRPALQHIFTRNWKRPGLHEQQHQIISYINTSPPSSIWNIWTLSRDLYSNVGLYLFIHSITSSPSSSWSQFLSVSSLSAILFAIPPALKHRERVKRHR